MLYTPLSFTSRIALSSELRACPESLSGTCPSLCHAELIACPDSYIGEHCRREASLSFLADSRKSEKDSRLLSEFTPTCPDFYIGVPTSGLIAERRSTRLSFPVGTRLGHACCKSTTYAKPQPNCLRRHKSHVVYAAERARPSFLYPPLAAAP